MGDHAAKSRLHPVDWENLTHLLAARQPRKGQRAVLRATIATPQGPLVVYSAHLEVYCGMLARIAQLSDIFKDSKQLITQGHFHQVILGDLNTMAHGIARLSPNYCCDRMRYFSLFKDEAVVWEQRVLSVPDPQFDPKLDSSRESGGASLLEAENKEERVNSTLLRWGVSPEFTKDATNPGFSCPFEASKTVTLDNPKYKFFGVSLMKGKLDWILMRRVGWKKKEIGNLDFKFSDHRWLLVEAVLE